MFLFIRPSPTVHPICLAAICYCGTWPKWTKLCASMHDLWPILLHDLWRGHGRWRGMWPRSWLTLLCNQRNYRSALFLASSKTGAYEASVRASGLWMQYSKKCLRCLRKALKEVVSITVKYNFNASASGMATPRVHQCSSRCCWSYGGRLIFWLLLLGGYRGGGRWKLS